MTFPAEGSRFGPASPVLKYRYLQQQLRLEVGAGWRASAAGGNAKSGAAVSGCGVSRHPRLGHAWGTSDSRSCSCGNPVFPQLAGCTRPNHPQRQPASMSLQGSLASMTCFGPRNPPQDAPGFGVRLDEEMPWAMTGPILRRGPVPHVPNPAYFPYSSPFQSVLFGVPFGFPAVILGWGDWSRFRHRQRRYSR